MKYTARHKVSTSHHKVFGMVGAHPLVHWGCGEGRVQAVQVEEQLAVVTRDERTYPAAPAPGTGMD